MQRKIIFFSLTIFMITLASAGASDLWVSVFKKPEHSGSSDYLWLKEHAPLRAEVPVPPPSEAELVDIDLLGSDGVKGDEIIVTVFSKKSFADIVAFYDAKLEGWNKGDMDAETRVYWQGDPEQEDLTVLPLPNMSISPIENSNGIRTRGKRSMVAVEFVLP